MTEPNRRRDERWLRESEFIRLLPDLLPLALDPSLRDFHFNLPIRGGGQVDLAATDSDSRTVIIEAKVITPQTQSRVRHSVGQILTYGQALRAQDRGRDPRMVLAITSALSPRYEAMFGEANIEVVDGPRLVAAAEALGLSTGLFQGIESAEQLARQHVSHPADVLISRLDGLTTGKASWSPYQRLAAEILEYLFSPPLEPPRYEVANLSKINRRDMIMANYAESGFWAFMRAHYEAHYVIVDAKNYSGQVKKNDILQLANYLSSHGAGLFGMVFTRYGSANAAEITRREQWAFHRKLVLIFNDDDLRQMLTAKRAGDSPETVVRQRIEDFRLDF